jgi:hypothetical protein
MSTSSDAPSGPEAKPENVAEATITEFLNRFVDETTSWLEDSVDAFNRNLHKALHPPGYTADELVKDVTSMCSRNLAYLGNLLKVTPPDAAAGRADETTDVVMGDPAPESEGRR